MPIVPHFDMPFRFSGSHAAVVDQDTLDDVSNCVEAILRTFEGQRQELPDFGIVDPVFNRQPIPLEPIIAAILDQEPRASILIEQAPDRFDSLIADLIVRVSAKEVHP